MMSISAIRHESREATARAEQAKRSPSVIWDRDTAVTDIRRAPFTGDYVPPGWTAAKRENYQGAIGEFAYACFDGEGPAAGLWLFVSTFGGDDDEPALNRQQLGILLPRLIARATELDRSLAVTITESGQFQVHLAVWER